MARRSKESTGLPLILNLFLILPWYVGPIVATTAYAGLRWFVPWLFPLPNQAAKTAADVVPHVIAAFAQAGRGVAPIAAALIMFVWLVAELLKLPERIREGHFAWPRFRNNRSATYPTTVLDSAMVSPDRPQKRQAVSNRSAPKGESDAPVPKQPRATINQPQPAPLAETTVQSSAVEREVDISRMTWKQFEKLLVQVLRRYGFQAEHTGRNGPDGGIDVRCTDSKGDTILVQCKHWSNKEVGVAIIREFFGVLIHEGAARGLVVTSGLFTQEAKKFAENKPLTLVDGEKLLKVLSNRPEDHDGAMVRYRISHLETVISSEQCPRCASRMIRKNGRRGFFLSCERYPECEGSRDV